MHLTEVVYNYINAGKYRSDGTLKEEYRLESYEYFINKKNKKNMGAAFIHAWRPFVGKGVKFPPSKDIFCKKIEDIKKRGNDPEKFQVALKCPACENYSFVINASFVHVFNKHLHSAQYSSGDKFVNSTLWDGLALPHHQRTEEAKKIYQKYRSWIQNFSESMLDHFISTCLDENESKEVRIAHLCLAPKVVTQTFQSKSNRMSAKLKIANRNIEVAAGLYEQMEMEELD